MSTLVLYIRSNQPDLSNMQTALLLIIYMTPGPHSPRDLAAQLRAPKSSVSRALGRLGLLGYVRQQRDPDDFRKLVIRPTDEGSAFLDGLKQVLGRRVRDPSERPC